MSHFWHEIPHLKNGASLEEDGSGGDHPGVTMQGAHPDVNIICGVPGIHRFVPLLLPSLKASVFTLPEDASIPGSRKAHCSSSPLSLLWEGLLLPLTQILNHRWALPGD